jgi:isocitrate/isopropylmalate dehydrogenase
MSALEIMNKLNPKTQTYEIVSGSKPDIDWQDVCGALATLPDLAFNLAYLLHNQRGDIVKGGEVHIAVKEIS